MLMHLSTPTYDLDGVVSIEVAPQDADFGETRRRMNRVATLDGGVAVNDFGHSEGDRTISLEWAATQQEEATVTRMVKLYPRLRLSCRIGFFDVVPESLSFSAGRARLTLLAIQKLSA